MIQNDFRAGFAQLELFSLPDRCSLSPSLARYTNFKWLGRERGGGRPPRREQLGRGDRRHRPRRRAVRR